MQSTRRPAFNFRRPVPTVPTCSPCPTAAPRQTISNVPHLHSNGIHSPLLLLSLALALLLSACPGAHACRAGSSSRNPYAYARAGGASRGAGSPPPPPVHKMPPLAFGTVWPEFETHAGAAGGLRSPYSLPDGVASGHLLCVRNRDLRFGSLISGYTNSVVGYLRSIATTTTTTTTTAPDTQAQSTAAPAQPQELSQSQSQEDAQVLNVGPQHEASGSRRRGRVLGSHRGAGAPMLRSHEPEEGPEYLRSCNAYVSPTLWDRLNVLSIYTMNQWPHKKLWVLDAWREAPEATSVNDKWTDRIARKYRAQRMQYEGRAVRVSLAHPRLLRAREELRAQLGMLARLAIESGFNYVNFRKPDYLYLAVRDEPISKEEKAKEGCFAADSNVLVLPSQTSSISSISSSSGSSSASTSASMTTSTIASSQKQMRELQLGDQVLAYDLSSGRPTYSPVIAWLHRDTEHEFEFVRLQLERERGTDADSDSEGAHTYLYSFLELTPEHLVYTLERRGTAELRAKFAGDVLPGELFVVLQHDRLTQTLNASCPRSVAKVVSVERRRVRRGAYAPLTAAGTLVVDGVLVSCYAAFPNVRLAHAAFAPYRALVRFGELVTSTFGHWLGSDSTAIGLAYSVNASSEYLYPTHSRVHWYAQMLIHVLHYFDRFIDYQSF